MIVIDASAIVELITDENGLAARVGEALYEDPEWVCPAHTVVEVASALRGLWLGGRSSREECEARIAALARIHPVEYSVTPLLERIMELAPNASAYDAAYVALAERLRVPLLTTDAKLARIPEHHADVRVIGRP